MRPETRSPSLLETSLKVNRNSAHSRKLRVHGRPGLWGRQHARSLKGPPWCCTASASSPDDERRWPARETAPAWGQAEAVLIRTPDGGGLVQSGVPCARHRQAQTTPIQLPVNRSGSHIQLNGCADRPASEARKFPTNQRPPGA